MTRGDGRSVVVVAFDDLLRAEQAARAADVWRSANRTLSVGPIMVVGRTVSGSVAVDTRGVVRPRAGAWRGFLVGLIVAGLPAAGIGGFLGWLLGTVMTVIGALIGFIDEGAATLITVAVTLGGAVVSGVLVGLVGGLIGAGIGALVGLIDSRSSGFTSSEVGAMAANVPSGDAIVAVSGGMTTLPLITDELTRLGGTPVAARTQVVGDGAGERDERNAGSP
jgi:hypothetical protein